MSEYDAHDIRARLNRAYDPVFNIVRELETKAEEILVEFDVDSIDSDFITTFMADLVVLEELYDEFLELVEEVSQGLEYESREAKKILESLRETKELFGDIRIHTENLLGFAKPNIKSPSDLMTSIISQLNATIKKLRETISEGIRPKIEKLLDEQSRIEHLFPDERNIEA